MRYSPKSAKPCFFVKLFKNPMQTSETTNATAAAVSSKRQKSSESDTPLFYTKDAKSYILSALAANITGIAAKNENSVAAFRLVPSIRAPSIVAPERDVPGTSASA